MPASVSKTSDLALKRGMPVTIITGFLGSGKTTLLNHILSNSNKKNEEWRSPPHNQLVLIGRHLNAEELQQQLTECLV